ncbi:STAS domain-containing protein [Leeia sp. TBRC 13508]|uniref:STAS domain-containing protein n=1 Tax=Leeia speluncae TaxID=2884804 RepID=A0ABS8D1D0_9NEIS|nr:STAS domain-containing protein [Leeia speluncae]MCB6182001.1 STAS domain-containing protein [Leeia speluncae]
MHIDVNKNNDVAIVGLSGRFDFSAHRDFRNAYQPALDDASVKELDIDFSRVEYVDSSALGMLLLLKEKAAPMNKKVVLVNCSGFVLEVFQVVNFQQLFEMR